MKAWKDDGYALEFEDSRLELTQDGFSEFIEQFRKLQEADIGDGETMATEFCVDLEDDDGE